MGRGVREFYGSTLRELKNAIDGFENHKKEQFQEYMYGVRKACYWTMKSMYGKKIKKESDLFPLEIDKAIRKAKIKNMKPVEITRIVKDGQ
jgi:hypothetical protein